MKKFTIKALNGLAQRPGKHSDGDGLYLRVTRPGRASWFYRYQRGGKEHWAGLGSFPAVGLYEAREAVAERRKELRAGIDPLEAKRAAAPRPAAPRTFGTIAAEYFALKRAGWSPKHAADWQTTILGVTPAGQPVATDICTKLRKLPVTAIGRTQIVDAIRPVWVATPTTGQRTFARIAAVLDYAIASGDLEGANPADWSVVSKVLPQKIKSVSGKAHHAAMDWRQLPKFFQKLETLPGLASAPTRFLILTASRANEVLGARWPEIDFDLALWRVPAERMKARTEHIVPLSAPAIALLQSLPHEHSAEDNGLIFLGLLRHRPMKSQALIQFLRPHDRNATIHGFRSSFRDWAAEKSGADFEAVEKSLAHRVGSEVERAYSRAPLIERRRQLMQAWADFLVAR